MTRSEPTNPLLNVSLNLPLDLVLWLDDLVSATHDLDDPVSRSGIVRMLLRQAQAELEADTNDILAEVFSPFNEPVPPLS